MMKIKYNLGQRCVAYLLLVGLLLQSCHSPSFLNSPSRQVPIEEKRPSTSISSASCQEESLEERATLDKLEEEPMALALVPSSHAEGLVSPMEEVKQGPMELALSQNEKSQIAYRQQSFNHRASRVASQGEKTNRSQSSKFRTHSLARQKSSQKLPDKKAGLARGNDLQSHQRLIESQKSANHKRRTHGPVASLEKVTKVSDELASTSQTMIPVGPSNLKDNQEKASFKPLLAKGGHKVRFKQLPSGKWQAVVAESLPAGISRKLLLPVFLEPGYSTDKLSKHSIAWQKNYIHVVLGKTKNYVYVGKMGLLGGMYQGEELDKEEGEDDDFPELETVNLSNKEEKEETSISEKDPFLLSAKDFEIGKVLGRGAFGTVYQCRLNNNGLYALKEIIFPRIPLQEQKEHISNIHAELNILRQLNHKNIVHLIGYHTPPAKDRLMLVMDLYDMSLSRYLTNLKEENCWHSPRKILLPPADTKQVAEDMLEGLSYLHSKQIAHRDIKPENVLINLQGLSKIKSLHLTDFGISKVVGPISITMTIAGTPGYMAPEILSGKYDPFKTDIYAFGKMLYECVTGNRPSGSVRMPLDEEEEYKPLLTMFEKCTQVAPRKRPDSKDLLAIIQGNLTYEAVDSTNKWNEEETLCQASVVGNQLKMLQLLHKKDPSLIKERTAEGNTLLHLAAELGYAEIAAWLDSQDPQQLKEKNTEGWTPLHLAAFGEQLDILEIFAKKIDSSFVLDIVGKPCPKAVRFLLEQGLDPLMTNSLKQTLLHLAAQASQEENVLVLLQKKLPIDALDAAGRTPLFLAVLQGHRPVVKVLLQHQARLDCASAEKETILHAAAFYGHTPLLTDLVPLCPQLIHAKDHDGKTPLHKAVWGNPKPDVVEFLLLQGAQVDEQNAYGYTALHWAAKHGHFESAQLLLKKGANCTVINQNGDTPLDLAIRWGQDALAGLLIDPKLAKRFFHQEQAPSQDPEGFYYQEFEAAYEQSEPLDQILYLEKLGDLFLSKEQYIQAAHLFNNALAAAIRYEFEESYQQLLLAKLERIEGLYLEQQLGLKTPATHKGYLFPYRRHLSVIRKEAQALLEKGNPIEKIQQRSNHHFRDLFSKIVTDCMELLGKKPPTAFAVLGLGSMARQEMCPYSDVEFAILIEKETPESMDYFRHLSQLIELRILNLGETAYPLIRPKRIGEVWTEGGSLTPHGFSMDTGGLAPLGKKGVYELIGTPDKLAAYQDPKWLEKNEGEVIVVNALTQGSFIMGNLALVETYQKRIQKMLEGKKSIFGKKVRQERALALLKGHLEEFGPLLDERRIDLRGFDVKKDLYRPLQMIIGSLALYYGLETTSTLAQIEELAKQGVLSKEGATRLEEAFKQALYWRFQAHLFYRNEKEILYHAQGAEDPLAQGLLTFGEKERQLLLEMYRVLIPFHQKAQLFLKGQQKSLSTDRLHDASVGEISLQDEEELNYKEAFKTYQQSVALNPLDLEALSHLQRMALQLGRAQEALKYNQERLSILKRKYGAQLDKQEKATECYNNIGVSLSYMGRHAEALEYHQKALEICKEVLGENHPSVATSYNNIGLSLSGIGRPAEALEYHKKALAIRKEVFGEKHPLVATTYNNIGASLRDLGRHAESMEYKKKALAIREEMLGENHPDLGTSYNNIGLSLSDLGRPAEALEYLKKALEVRKKVLGEKHPDVATSYNSIGASLRDLGRPAEALEYDKKSLAIRKEVLGDKHPAAIAKSYSNIGASLDALGSHTEALEYNKKALAIHKEVLGENHPDLATHYNNIGWNLSKLERHAEALEYYQKSLAIRKEMLGEKHLDVAATYSNIGLSLSKLGKHTEALEYYQKALAIRKEVLGDKHTLVAINYDNIGIGLSDVERYAEALEYYQKALAIRKEVLGQKHLDVANSYNSIGLSLSYMKRPAEALEYTKKSLAIQKEVLGDKHPDLATSYGNMVVILRELGRYTEASEYMKKYAAIIG